MANEDWRPTTGEIVLIKATVLDAHDLGAVVVESVGRNGHIQHFNINYHHLTPARPVTPARPDEAESAGVHVGDDPGTYQG